MAVNDLGKIMWLCPLLPNACAHVKIWYWYGSRQGKEAFLEYEVGVHAKAYK